MSKEFTDPDLEAYLDEALDPHVMSSVESELRSDEDLGQRLAAINGRRDAGVHSVGEIWRRNHISCPTRQQLGSYLLKALEEEQMSYCRFHLEQVSCRYCNANLDDLRAQQEESAEAMTTRRTKYFQSSAGYLQGDS